MDSGSRWTRLLTFALALVALAGLAAGCGTIDRMTGVATACDLKASGIAAQAEILSIWETGWTINEEPVIGMKLKVLATDRPSFEAVVPRTLIGRLDVPRFQPGNRVPVVYDPKDPSRIGIDVYECR